MMMQFFNDHRPFDPPHKYAHLYNGQRIPEPSTFWDDYRERSAGLKANQLSVGDMTDWDAPKGLTDRQRKQYNYQKLMQHFLGTLKSQDDNIGRLLDYLDQSGLADNTIVVYTSDHGFFLGEHGLFDKRLMYEESIRVPWMIRYPGMVKPGSTSERMNINIDNAPTILDLVNLPVPKDMQGESLKPILEGEGPDNWRSSMYYHYYEKHWALPSYGIRTKRYKLIHYYTIDEWELFDLEKDPDEMESLFESQDPFSYGKYKAKLGYKSVVKDLVKQLNNLRKKYKDITIKPVHLKPA
jgi:arylsulfatase A-like enzyme